MDGTASSAHRRHCKPHMCQLLSSVAGSLLYRLLKLFLDQDNIFPPQSEACQCHLQRHLPQLLYMPPSGNGRHMHAGQV